MVSITCIVHSVLDDAMSPAQQQAAASKRANYEGSNIFGGPLPAYPESKVTTNKKAQGRRGCVRPVPSVFVPGSVD